MTIPDEAVQAAKGILYYANPNDVKSAITAALPFLQGVKVKALEWKPFYTNDGREVSNYTCGLQYHVSEEGWWFALDELNEASGIEAAKAAAQADYESRFWSMAEVSAPDMGNLITLFYTNYRGETSERTITPIKPWFGATEWHPEPQWLLTAFDHEKQANRDFALKDFGYPTPSPRAQALEEAAQALEAWGDIYGDNAAKCVRALSSQPVADGWLPIETAPKDGTVIQAWHKVHECPVSVLWKDDGFPYKGERLNWYERSYTTAWPERAFTHWRHLPQAPGVEV